MTFPLRPGSHARPAVVAMALVFSLSAFVFVVWKSSLPGQDYGAQLLDNPNAPSCRFSRLQASVTVGATMKPILTVRNTSSAPLRPGSHVLAPLNDYWGTEKVKLTQKILPNRSVVFVLPLRVPATPGSYPVSWQIQTVDGIPVGEACTQRVTVLENAGDDALPPEGIGYTCTDDGYCRQCRIAEDDHCLRQELQQCLSACGSLPPESSQPSQRPQRASARSSASSLDPYCVRYPNACRENAPRMSSRSSASAPPATCGDCVRVRCTAGEACYISTLGVECFRYDDATTLTNGNVVWEYCPPSSASSAD